MGIAATVRSADADADVDVAEPAPPAATRELDVDDVRLLLNELRLRRQLRGQD